MTKERINELEDRLIENRQSKEQREKLRKKEQSFRKCGASLSITKKLGERKEQKKYWKNPQKKTEVKRTRNSK
jgi:hypothetical protein